MGSPKIKLGKHSGGAPTSGQKRGPGRPSKFNEATKNAIIGAIRAGNYPDAAAGFAGVDVSTFYRWMARGEADEPGYCEFRDSIKKAESVSECGRLSIISRAAMGSPVEYMVNAAGEIIFGKDGKPVIAKHEKDPVWTAAAWMLERKHPEKYGRRLEGTIKGVGDRGEILVRHKHVVDLSKIPSEDLRTLREIAVRTQALQAEEGETIH